ncbi:MAG: RecX family transcriptional regulator [Candidatus Woykebacteria bacterium]
MKITNIEPQKKKQRFNIFLNGEFSFGVSADVLFEEKLKVGRDLDESEVSKVIEQDQTKRLLDKSLRLLSYRPRSEKEVRDYLLRKQKIKEIEKSEVEKAQYEKSIERVISRLKDLDQIDDKEFALWWAEQRSKFKPLGQSLIKLELRQKGIDVDIIEEVAKGAQGTEETNGSEVELAKKAALKKLGSYKNLEKAEFRVKMGQFLARRGFSWDIIKKVVDTLSKKG